jgi:hypothetical protein
MTCNCEFGGKCSMVSNCYMDQELADKQEDIDSLRAELDALRAAAGKVTEAHEIAGSLWCDDFESALADLRALLNPPA